MWLSLLFEQTKEDIIQSRASTERILDEDRRTPDEG